MTDRFPERVFLSSLGGLRRPGAGRAARSCIAALSWLVVAAAAASDAPLYLDRTASTEDRVADLLSRLTVDEKLTLVVADPSAGTSLDTAMIERLKIPRFSMTDGPHGASFAKHFGAGATAFPAGITLASTWNATLLRAVAAAIAEETRAEGRNVILGPCVNIHRTPYGGRNFESFSEDPYLAARLATAYVQGVQSRGVVACLKHFACNNQERDRMSIDARVGERALREIYLPAFRAGVQEGGALFVMSAYNKVNGNWASENRRLLTEILKEEWGFQGAVISDWGAVHSTLPTAQAGLDLEMGGTTFLGPPLGEAIRNGDVSEDVLDEKVRRLLRVMMSIGIFDQPWQPRSGPAELYKRPLPTGRFAKSMYELPTRFDNDPLDGPEHRALALQAAREGMVLLKNEGGALPLDREMLSSIAVIGPNGAWGNRGGGGSSETPSSYVTTPLEAILKIVGEQTTVRYELGSTFDRRYYVPQVAEDYLSSEGRDSLDAGLRAEYFSNPDLQGDPTVTRTDAQVFFHWGGNPPVEGLPAHNWSVRWTGRLTAPESGAYRLYLFHHGAFYAQEQGDGARLFVNGELVVDNWRPKLCRVPTADLTLQAGEPVDIRLEYHDAGPGKQAIMILGWLPRIDDPIGRAVAAARDADAVLLCLGDNNYYVGENNDRGDLSLPGDQEHLVRAVCAANPRTIVALYNGSPFLMEDWLKNAPAVIECWYPNQEGGTALAELVFGLRNFSGKLPVTIGRRREDYPDFGRYPGNGTTVDYAEGIFVGYRHFDQAGLEPTFPFGHGLSYTTFHYSDLKITPTASDSKSACQVSCTVANSGARSGRETVQLYVCPPDGDVPRPKQELKGFQKVALRPGEKAQIKFDLSLEDLSYFDVERDEWRAPPGVYRLRISASSRDVRLAGDFVLDGALSDAIAQ